MAELAEQEGGDERAALQAVARRRLAGWLVRRGFGVGEVMRVVRELVP